MKIPECEESRPQQLAVSGLGTPVICAAWDAPSGGFAQMFADPSYAEECNLPADQLYNAQTNPRGVRCTLQDYMASLFGTRPSDGFASFPFDNVGVQYGFSALNSRQISPEQFVDLNEKIGGFDVDWKAQANRSQADPAALQVAQGPGGLPLGEPPLSVSLKK